jgi:hypothetical protein
MLQGKFNVNRHLGRFSDFDLLEGGQNEGDAWDLPIF